MKKKTTQNPKLFLSALLSGAIIACAAAPAHAVSITYDAKAAIDVDDGMVHDHVLWFPGIDFTVNEFTTGGQFIEDLGAGTATLTGTATTNGTDGFIISATFGGYVGNTIPDSTADAPSDSLGTSPKDEGHASDAGNWRYYTTTSGTITGVGSYAGQIYTLARMGPSFQIGFGASGKNDEFGASGWLAITAASPAAVAQIGSDTKKGDFNIDLHPVPEGGTTLLMLAFAAGLVFRFKRN